VMDRWPTSQGEAIHTSTFLGHPTACAAGLASIEQMRENKLVERCADLESTVRDLLAMLQKDSKGRIGDVRGRGLMWGLECVDAAGAPRTELAAAIMLEAMRHGLLVLTSGPQSNVVAISPPLVITAEQLRFGVDVLSRAFARV
ncbi:MAG TPA: aminotransferase class III-fold pyridoxal phosphate-dependent enzyme, partial [Candidatus Acidoferrales bacterium]|nr:aminotransferase class III-fold pyridoxal phosphate-dependent enzyme [Candidatus Acidoferrales bacterium]